MVARGEVRWAAVGPKRRPVVLLTRDVVVRRLSSILVAPCTTTVRDIPSEVPLDAADGMPKACVVNLDNTTLVDVGQLGDLVTTLDRNRMRQICTALTHAVGCDRV